MAQRVYIHTFGCRVNQAETAALQNDLEARGFVIASGVEQADIVVVNTCTVTARGDADTRKFVRRVVRRRPAARLAVIGCQAQLQPAAVARLPGVAWVVGSAAKMRLGEILALPPPAGAPAHIVRDEPTPEPFSMPAAGRDRRHTRANLKIQDGCDSFCSYCAVPYARGRARPRRFDEVLTAADALIAAGHREIVLAGVNVGMYRCGDHGLLEVIDAILARPGLGRLRLSSVEPDTIGPPLLARMAANARFCRHLHLPLQSGSDAVLQRMNRRYTVAEYAALVRAAAARMPGVCIGADVMVGFPGESEAEFQQTRDLLAALPLAYLHVFSYSPRPPAKAARLAAQPASATCIRARSAELRRLGDERRRAFLSAAVGQTVMVLFETRRANMWTGVSDNYLRVSCAVDGDPAGRLLPVRLTRVTDAGVVGELVTRETSVAPTVVS